jgi:cAMP phosphodiesterase
MDIRVLGCYGSHLPGYGTTSFLLEETMLIDGGTITSVLTLEEQLKIEYVFLTHAHLDHIRDIMFLVDNIFYLKRPAPLVLVSTPQILDTVHAHLFNGHIWPDFSAIPSSANPVLKMLPIHRGEILDVGSWQVTATPVNHTVETMAYTLESDTEAVIFIGDTGPTEKIWEEANGKSQLKGIFIETSFPNRMEEMARLTGHLTPRGLAAELAKLRHKKAGVYVFHVKLHHDEEIETELRDLPDGRRIHLLRDGQRIHL